MNPWFFVLIFILIILDQILKFILSDVSIDYGFIALTSVQNTGISFGLFQGSSVWVIIISIIILGALYYYRKEFKGKEVFLSLIIAGIIGNLIDRIGFGYVRDFIDLKWWPVFNLADSFLFIGVFGIIILFLIEHFKEKKSK